MCDCDGCQRFQMTGIAATLVCHVSTVVRNPQQAPGVIRCGWHIVPYERCRLPGEFDTVESLMAAPVSDHRGFFPMSSRQTPTPIPPSRPAITFKPTAGLASGMGVPGSLLAIAVATTCPDSCSVASARSELQQDLPVPSPACCQRMLKRLRRQTRRLR